MNPATKTAMPAEELILSVTANFTAEPIGDTLRFWMAQLGLEPVRVDFSSYNQIFQELLAPDSVLASGARGVNFVLVRLEDWARDLENARREEACTDAARQFVGALTSFAPRSRRPTILLLCPQSASIRAHRELAGLLASLEEQIVAEVRGLRGVTVITGADVAALYPVDVVDDPESDRQGHIPFTRAYWVALGTMLARKARTFLQPPHKVIAVDADNTIWGGVVAEVGADQVHVGGEWRALQEFLAGKKKQGIVLALVSKNQEEDVAEVFRRPDMILRREDFVAWKVNWKPKSENLRALASELDLGLDGFIFIDDNPMECAEVAAHCPSITVLPLPAQGEGVPAFLRHVWALDLLPATSADKGRTEQYRQQAERQQFRASVSSFREFIESLDLKVDLSAPAPEQFERAAQLTQRTNQFNATGVRRTTAELASLLTSGERCARMVRVQDRFGDYGDTGLCVYAVGERELRVENFLLSCRVLGKGVEHRLLSALGRTAGELGKADVVIPFRRTERNEPAARFLEAVGGAFREGDSYRFPAAQAESVVFNPRNVEEAEAESGEEPDAKASRRSAGCDFNEIARKLATVTEIQLATRRMYSRSRPPLATPFVPPRNAAEETLAGIWADVLALDRVGIHDDFFDLGGDSILSVQIISRSSQSGLRFTLRQHFQHPTIAELTSAMGSVKAPPDGAAANGASHSTPEFSLARLGQQSIEQLLARLPKVQR